MAEIRKWKSSTETLFQAPYCSDFVLKWCIPNTWLKIGNFLRWCHFSRLKKRTGTSHPDFESGGTRPPSLAAMPIAHAHIITLPVAAGATFNRWFSLLSTPLSARIFFYIHFIKTVQSVARSGNEIKKWMQPFSLFEEILFKRAYNIQIEIINDKR